MIKNGSVVHFEYTLSDDNGDIIQSTKGTDPVSYTHGEHKIIPALERALSGMKINEQKTIRVEPQDAYGSVDPKGFKEIPRSEIPAAAAKAGTALSARGPQGEDLLIHVHEVKQDTVVLDFNHPLAGKTLNFDVRVVDIEPK